ncbi:hypothetical protein [Oligoflexus tunisiensis]|uniref:hypothetical protein n=1 Tax=Oligoflexus tunisiensis TaxID=708132 RepID=UPI00114CAF9B|nr:hypothetical protein [Oligoflexus tunisiensis]
MKKLWLGWWILGLLHMNACTGKSQDQSHEPLDIDFCTRMSGEGLEEFQRELLQKISASTCPGTCPLENLELTPGAARAESLGQRILLIDDAVDLPAFTRYRSRTLASLRLHPSGRYEETHWKTSINRDALGILEQVNNYKNFIPVACLDVALPFLEKFGAQLPQLTGHGMDILPSLADANPKAQFVVSEDQLSDVLTKDRLCPLLNDDVGAWSQLDEAISHMEESLVAAIQKHAINYVHLSWGLEDKGLRERFKMCGLQQPSVEIIQKILDRYAMLFERMTQLRSPTDRGEQPVYIFQAAPSASYTLQENDPNYALDCRLIPGRIRVNAASYHGFDIPDAGSSGAHALAAHESNGKACTNFYIVTGYKGLFDPEARRERIPSAPLGLGYLPAPSWPSASSFANPLGLSLFLYQRQLSPQAGHEEVLQGLLGQGSPRVYDPLLHKQLQIFED